MVSIVIGNSAQKLVFDPRVTASFLKIFYTIISVALLLPGDSAVGERLKIVTKNAKIIMLIDVSRRFYIIPAAIFFLILNYGVLKSSLDVGLRFLLLASIGVLAVFLTTLLLKMSIKMIAYKLSSASGKPIVRYEKLCKVYIVTIMIMIYIISSLLCRPDSSISHMTATLSSPLGGTIPISGWASAIVYAAIEGELASGIVPVILNFVFVTTMVLLLLVFDENEYENATFEYSLENVNNNKITLFIKNITNYLEDGFYKLFGGLSGELFANLYSTAVIQLRDIANSIIKIVASAFLILIFAIVINSSEAIDNLPLMLVFVFIASVYIEIIGGNTNKDIKKHKTINFVLSEVIASVPMAMLRALAMIVPASVVFLMTIQNAISIFLLRFATSLAITLIRAIFRKHKLISSHILLCLASIATCFAM